MSPKELQRVCVVYIRVKFLLMIRKTDLVRRESPGDLLSTFLGEE